MSILRKKPLSFGETVLSMIRVHAELQSNRRVLEQELREYGENRVSRSYRKKIENGELLLASMALALDQKLGSVP